VGVSENIETVRAFYGAGSAIDDRERYPFADPAIVWHVPGANHVSGRWEGVAAVFEEMPAKMQPLDEWDLEVVDIFGNADLVMTTVQLRGRRGDIAVECTGGHVFRLDANAKIVEAWGFVRDQAQLDRLLDS
jgi:hypothetical protein